MLLRSDILTEADGKAVAVDNPEGGGTCLFVCEHASHRMPERAGNLGLDADALVSHIVWDPGALAVARRLSALLDGTLVHQCFSRLVYDCNRPPESPAAMPDKSEIYDIPGNRDLSPAERYARTAALYIPFHDRISGILAERQAQGRKTVVVTVHSFTPIYMGKQREVEIGILHDADSRLADEMLSAAGGGPFRAARNEPYGPEDGVTHSLRLHALPGGHLNVMIEVRNDLIRDENGERAVADYLAGLLRAGLEALSS
ncbi:MULTISPECIES: N-formylglutamate amidohydrolase [Alphaproteobacteria]|uniref:N-formylglutamate amidohydrolase n=2 Tax=Alphaproteobacteria TaxID=28211 RepID=A0A512HEF3_9HYPH|nr:MULTISPECIES: N-formylglutamate amidohydrolase [Alphaproteobacteria]GEO83838.1 N-formylglutamate amidohydrolase [Ciceribacter naphthalenivorans]GLR21284.1 N-formylglutamate amidohydrolase [Ciceribacter naphthalenivorans]GLT04140.1 N-formylglutamate amidohydrolase [Sphingomonas psychrolutea]